MGEGILEARQRFGIRRAVELSCQVVSDRGFRLLGTQALDLSVEGMLLRSDAEVDVGEDVVLTFRTPHGQSWVDAEATVTRIAAGRRAGDRGRCIGLHFGHMARRDRAVLEGSLRGLPPPVPARPVRRDYATTVRLISMW